MLSGWLAELGVSEVLSRARNQGEQTTGPLHFILVQYIVTSQILCSFLNTNPECFVTLWQASNPIDAVTSTSIGSFLVSVSHFGNPCTISEFFIITIFATVICDQ